MLRHRILPVLLLDQSGLVKTTKFRDPTYIGDPVNAVRIFNDKGADELAILDISASRLGRAPDMATISEVASQAFMPLAYGGGVSTVALAESIYTAGVEKIVLRTAAYCDNLLVAQISAVAGAQALAVSVDLRKDLRRRWVVHAPGTPADGDPDWTGQVKRFQDLGAGEILLQVVPRDGTMSGMELSVIKAAASATDLPLTAISGVGSLDDMRAALHSGATAIGVGAFFVFNGPRRAVLISYPTDDELNSLHQEA